MSMHYKFCILITFVRVNNLVLRKFGHILLLFSEEIHTKRSKLKITLTKSNQKMSLGPHKSIVEELLPKN